MGQYILKREKIQNEASQVILDSKDALLFISIRLGKTRIALKAIEKDESVLIIYPNIAIKDSWLSEIEKFKPLSDNITYVVKNSIKKYENKSFDYIIIDEPQLLSLNQLKKLKTIKYKKRVALTGTLKNNTIDRLRNILGLEIKYKYDISNAIKDRLVKDYSINIHVCDLDNNIKDIAYKKFKQDILGTEKQVYDNFTKSMEYFDSKFNDSGDVKYNLGFKKYMGLRTNLLYNSKSLYKLAQDLIYEYRDDKALIYTLRRDIADKLSLKSYHSTNKNKTILDNFKESIDSHLSVVNCVQAGVTIKNLNRVIFHTYESNTEIFYQKLGRSLLYDYKDNKSNIHICCLKDTQMEIWVNNACKSLEQDKIKYIYKGKEYTKSEWIKFTNPGKDIYIYNGEYCYKIKNEYYFISNPYKAYNLLDNKVLKI